MFVFFVLARIHGFLVLYRHSLLALCVQVLDPHRYHAAGTSEFFPNYLLCAQNIAQAVIADMGLDLVAAHAELESTEREWKNAGDVYILTDEVMGPWRSLF